MKKIAILFFLFLLIFTGCYSDGEKALDRLSDSYSLEDAKEDGCVTFEDIDITSGQQRWDDFVKAVESGKPASVRLAYYYTIGDPDRLGGDRAGHAQLSVRRFHCAQGRLFGLYI